MSRRILVINGHPDALVSASVPRRMARTPSSGWTKWPLKRVLHVSSGTRNAREYRPCRARALTSPKGERSYRLPCAAWGCAGTVSSERSLMNSTTVTMCRLDPSADFGGGKAALAREENEA